MEKEANKEYIKKIIDMTKKHFEKYGNKKMTLQELDKLYSAPNNTQHGRS